MIRRTIALPLLALSACGGGASTEAGWTAVSETDLTSAQTAQLEAAREAQTALFQGLLGRLMESRAKVGAAGSIQVCSEIAPALAEEIGEQRGLRIGRTAARLRNPANAAPDWAADRITADGPTEPVVVTHSDGRLATMHPIFLMKPCLACHGAPDQLEEGVADALAKVYPDDRATGFAVGDLRGWFWVEVPAESN